MAPHTFEQGYRWGSVGDALDQFVAALEESDRGYPGDVLDVNQGGVDDSLDH
jgi:hypothetical protein